MTGYAVFVTDTGIGTITQGAVAPGSYSSAIGIGRRGSQPGHNCIDGGRVQIQLRRRTDRRKVHTCTIGSKTR